MRLLLTALVLILIVAPIGAQQTARHDEWRLYDIDPALVPTSPTNALTVTVEIAQLNLINETAGDLTCIILDRQSVPRSIAGSIAAPITLAAGKVWIMSYPFGRRAKNGVTWSCSGSGVTGHIVYWFPDLNG